MNPTVPAFPAAWSARFADLQTLPTSLSLPAHDGDIAWLHHLRREICARMPAPITTAPPDFIWHQTIDATWINPTQILRYWPADTAAGMLRNWRAGR